MTFLPPDGAPWRPSMADSFGVPDNVFGDVPERFYGALGRIAALGALVEMRLGQVCIELEQVPETDVAGLQMKPLLDRFENEGKKRVAAGRSLPEALVLLVEAAQEAMSRRNEVVHSLWPNPTLEGAKGWRTVRPKKRVDASNPVVWVDVDERRLLALIADLVRIARELRDIVSATNALT